jgi:hypothetical protein
MQNTTQVNNELRKFHEFQEYQKFLQIKDSFCQDKENIPQNVNISGSKVPEDELKKRPL